MVGRQLSSARHLAETANTVVGESRQALASAVVVRDADESERIAALADLNGDLERLHTSLANRDLGPDSNLISSLASARDSAEMQLAELETMSATAVDVTAGLESFLSNSRYLLLAANVNEMQAGAGTPLSLGVVEFVDGDFRVSTIRTVEDYEPVRGLPSVDASVAELWGFLSPTNDFKKLMLTPRFNEFGGPQSLDLYERVEGDSLDGALVVDPIALQSLLRVVGPVTVEGETFDADNVLRYVFVDQYEEFLTGDEVSLDNLSTLSEGQAARRDRLAGLASAAVSVLAEGQLEPLSLIEALRPVAAGRHVLAYGAEPSEQAMWTAMGIDGSLDGDEFGVALMNIGANKLDPFMDVDVEVTSTDAGDNATEYSVRVAVGNRAPTTLPQAVGGYYWDEPLGLPTPTSYLGRLMLIAPGATTEIEVVSGAEQVEVHGRDGGNAVIVARLAPIVEDTTRTVEFRVVAVTDDETEWTIMPSARYPAEEWNWEGETFHDDRPRPVPG